MPLFRGSSHGTHIKHTYGDIFRAQRCYTYSDSNIQLQQSKYASRGIRTRNRLSGGVSSNVAIEPRLQLHPRTCARCAFTTIARMNRDTKPVAAKDPPPCGSISNSSQPSASAPSASVAPLPPLPPPPARLSPDSSTFVAHRSDQLGSCGRLMVYISECIHLTGQHAFTDIIRLSEIVDRVWQRAEPVEWQRRMDEVEMEDQMRVLVGEEEFEIILAEQRELTAMVAEAEEKLSGITCQQLLRIKKALGREVRRYNGLLSKEKIEQLRKYIEGRLNRRYGESNEHMGLLAYELASESRVQVGNDMFYGRKLAEYPIGHEGSSKAKDADVDTNGDVDRSYLHPPRELWLGGRVDGFNARTSGVVEVKTRSRPWRWRVNPYDLMQLQCYMHVCERDGGELVEQVRVEGDESDTSANGMHKRNLALPDDQDDTFVIRSSHISHVTHDKASHDGEAAASASTTTTDLDDDIDTDFLATSIQHPPSSASSPPASASSSLTTTAATLRPVASNPLRTDTLTPLTHDEEWDAAFSPLPNPSSSLTPHTTLSSSSYPWPAVAVPDPLSALASNVSLHVSISPRPCPYSYGSGSTTTLFRVRDLHSEIDQPMPPNEEPSLNPDLPLANATKTTDTTQHDTTSALLADVDSEVESGVDGVEDGAATTAATSSSSLSFLDSPTSNDNDVSDVLELRRTPCRRDRSVWDELIVPSLLHFGRFMSAFLRDEARQRAFIRARADEQAMANILDEIIPPNLKQKINQPKKKTR